jgi:glutathione S-transferase
MQKLLFSRLGSDFDDPTTETAVYKSAEETLTLLSKRLGSEPYLFGKSPTSADAVLYAHLVRRS